MDCEESEKDVGDAVSTAPVGRMVSCEIEVVRSGTERGSVKDTELVEVKSSNVHDFGFNESRVIFVERRV